MRLLLNMNLPRELGRLLELQGHVWRHVGDIGMGGASDADVIAEAVRCGETILTHDLDYGQLLAFSGASAPSVVIFRLRGLSAADLASRLETAWPSIDGPLTRGAVAIIEAGGIRIRALPIGGSPAL